MSEIVTELTEEIMKKLENETSVLSVFHSSPKKMYENLRNAGDLKKFVWLYFAQLGIYAYDICEDAEVQTQSQFLEIVKKACPKKWIPKIGDTFYVPSILFDDGYQSFTYTSCIYLENMVEKGIAFQTKCQAYEAAQRMLKTLEEN